MQQRPDWQRTLAKISAELELLLVGAAIDCERLGQFDDQIQTLRRALEAASAWLGP